MTEIPLTRGMVALIDDEDYGRIAPHRWHVVGPMGTFQIFYAGRHEAQPSRRFLLMHHVILDIPGSQRIDHRNHDGLDNRRENLRPCTQAQNRANQRKVPGLSSRFKGVTWDKERNLWVAKIQVRQRTLFLGRFVTESAAAGAYDKAAQTHFGEFALTNLQQTDQ